MTLSSDFKQQYLTQRPRRLRHHPKIRELVSEVNLSVNDLVMPLFIKHGLDEKVPVSSMPGLFQLGLKHLEQEIDQISQLNIPAILLFGIPEHKDEMGSDSYQQQGIIQQAIAKIKSVNSDLLVITDSCFCEYTDHGHCGFIDEHTGKPDVDNDKTLDMLINQTLAQVEAGADMVAPSGSIDGMVAAIRHGLDQSGYHHIPIMSYSVKYASAAYGPFRNAAEGAPSFGDRRTYQMDPRSHNEALREVALDIAEGADILMVKPGMPYLDVIHRIKQTYPEYPLAAYHVSGEYSQIKAAAQLGWLDEKSMVLESLTSMKRAGADFIINYFSKQVATWLK